MCSRWGWKVRRRLRKGRSCVTALCSGAPPASFSPPQVASSSTQSHFPLAVLSCSHFLLHDMATHNFLTSFLMQPFCFSFHFLWGILYFPACISERTWLTCLPSHTWTLADVWIDEPWVCPSPVSSALARSGILWPALCPIPLAGFWVLGDNSWVSCVSHVFWARGIDSCTVFPESVEDRCIILLYPQVRRQVLFPDQDNR